MDTESADEVRTLGRTHNLGTREIEALTIFVACVQSADQGDRVKERWRKDAVPRLVRALTALELEQVRLATDAADIGSGAGFPGLALAAALPATSVTLIEPNSRRCAFLRRTIEAMGLANVEVVQQQVQFWEEGRRRFDLVTSRGLMAARVMLGLAAPLLKVGGALVLWLPEIYKVEAEADAQAARTVGLVPTGIVDAESGGSLHTYAKLESAAAGVAGRVEAPLRLDDSALSEKRRRLVAKLPMRETRLAKVAGMIADLEAKRSSASGKKLARLDSDIERLKARQAALTEQLESLRRLASPS
jgi:16S rRNA (guanine527-N7)-methyltransferase